MITPDDTPPDTTGARDAVDVARTLALAARDASIALRRTTALQRTAAIEAMAATLRASANAIATANARDLEAAHATGLSGAKRDRLTLDAARLEAVARGLDEIARLPDPVGRVLDDRVRPNGLRVQRVRVPLGVILMIFEARPNVTAEAAALCLRAGNAVLLRGGSESRHTNAAIGEAIREGLAIGALPADAVQVITDPRHAIVRELLVRDAELDLVIPRGGERLIRAVAEQSRIPVLKHYKGNCHVYVDAHADLAMAARIAVNAKVQRPGVCNAMEHLLVHVDVAGAFLPPLGAELRAAGVELRADARAHALLPGSHAATDADWDAEYLDLVLGVKVVDTLDEAIAHVSAHGSRHSDAIVTRDEAAAQRFLTEVDSASVLWNASTRLADGGEYGLGAEIGISTDKLHARGPMGAEELTCAKWVVTGNGQVRG
jgi:glutamate-5-semialdehyde dehydrogenase